MRRVVRIQRQGKVKDVPGAASAAGVPTEEIDAQVALIQALIPLGLQAVAETLEAEVVALAGARYERTRERRGVVRWGQQPGSVYLADQKLPIRVPRVRDRVANQEIPLGTYARLQHPRAADAGLFRKILVGLTCRQYAACAEAVPQAFGLSASSVSRRFIRASARQLQTLCERRLDQDEFVALVLDGKTFAEDTMVIALGGHPPGTQKDPGCRPDRDGECVGLRGLLADAGRPRVAGRGGPAVCHRWGQRAAHRDTDGVRHPGPGPAVSVA
ncbi:MAG: transposase [Nitrospirota bacterium]|nr:transposase [Nitrospirota bacterium]